MSRIALLALLVSLLLASALGATVTYTVYSDSACANAIASGTVPALAAPSSVGGGYLSGCFPIANVPSGGYAQSGCFTPSNTNTYTGVLQTFTDGQCSNNNSVTLYADAPPGTCGPAILGGSGSINVNCNSAFNIPRMSVPLLAALLVLAFLLR